MLPIHGTPTSVTTGWLPLVAATTTTMPLAWQMAALGEALLSRTHTLTKHRRLKYKSPPSSLHYND